MSCNRGVRNLRSLLYIKSHVRFMITRVMRKKIIKRASYSVVWKRDSASRSLNCYKIVSEAVFICYKTVKCSVPMLDTRPSLKSFFSLLNEGFDWWEEGRSCRFTKSPGFEVNMWQIMSNITTLTEESVLKDFTELLTDRSSCNVFLACGSFALLDIVDEKSMG